jgi:hypothetical protein
MKTIYLDHNVVSGIAGIPAAPDAETLRAYATELKKSGYRFALSAWNMYELARSDDIKHVEQCCAFVEELDPIWVSNTHTVKSQEVARYLQPIFDCIGPVRSKVVVPFHLTVAEMWSTYGGPTRPDETFRGTVLALRSDPRNIERVERAANLTPNAILTGRQAKQNGALKFFKFIIDRGYFEGLVPRGTPSQQVNFLMKTIKRVIAASPAIAVEEALTQHRVKDSFKPTPNDAADLQHALVPLAYCDYFVTGDKHLHEQCRIVAEQAKLPCQVCKSLLQIGGKAAAAVPLEDLLTRFDPEDHNGEVWSKTAAVGRERSATRIPEKAAVDRD